MPGVTDTRTMNDVLTTTLEHIRPKIVDNFYDDYPFLSFLNGKLRGAISGESPKTEVQGGERIRTHLVYASDPTAKAYTGAETLDTTITEAFTTAFYAWKQYAATIGITGLEEFSNRGEEAITNLLKARTENAMMSLKDLQSRHCWGDGTAANSITGIQAIVDASSTLAGLAPGTYTTWAATENTVTDTYAQVGYEQLSNAFNTISYGSDMPNAIFTTQVLWEAIERDLVGRGEVGLKEKVGNIGFSSITFKGVSCVFDRDCPSGEIYLLNSRHLKLVCHRDRDFKVSPFVSPDNQDIRTAKVLWMGNMITDERRKLGAVSGFTDT